MDRELVIKTLNKNIQSFDVDAVNLFIIAYLDEKGIDKSRISAFVNELFTNPILRIDNAFHKCLNHCISYYLNKFSINSILENNRAIYYY